MLRRSPLKRTAFRRKPAHEPSVKRSEHASARKAANMAALMVPSRAVSVAVLGRCEGAAKPAPKSEPKRNRALLDMARGMPCLLRVPGVCSGERETTVAAHSNLAIHGKAGARKADDQYSVWSCAACHSWLDQGRASADEKERAFMAGHLRQVNAWRGIAAHDPFLRDRNAAQWALDQLGATPVGETA